MLPKLWPPRYGHPPAAERAWFLSRERCSCLILLILVIIGKRFPLILPDPLGLRPQAPNLLNARRAQTVQSSVPVAHGTTMQFRRDTQRLRTEYGRNKMRKSLLVPIMLALAALTAGCNTMEGMGEDIERGGEKIQREAR